MRILDDDNNKALDNVIIYLEMDEAKQLAAYLRDLITKNDPTQHHHTNDSTYKHEITVVIYDENKLDSLDERSKKLIREDV